jgi:endo-1,4-beta-xylanase
MKGPALRIGAFAACASACATVALMATGSLPDRLSNQLITDAGWECVQGARIVDGALVISSVEGFAPLNDSVVRLQTGRDVAVSVTLETEMGPGSAGLLFWNSQPGPGDASAWYQAAAKIALGIVGRRPFVAIFDGTGPTAAFQYTSPQPIQGRVTIAAAREADAVVIRIEGVEAARTAVLGPLTDGPLFFGPSVGRGKTLTVHRISVTDGTHPNSADVVRAMAPAIVTGNGTTLRGSAAARGRLVGVAMASRTLRWNQQGRDVAAREFSLLWGADAFGLRVIHPARDQYLFCTSDQLVAFAEANHMRVAGGSGGLLWGQLPPWLAGGTFSRDELIAIMREFITTVVGRYRGRVQIWNVANEVLEYNNTGNLLKGDQQIWMRGIGPEYLDMAFRWAHEADPAAILVLNEVGAEGTRCAVRCGPGNADGSRNVKAEAFYELVKGMRARGVPIHAVGMQTHLGAHMGWPTSDLASVAAQMNRLAGLGVDVYITEMDVPIERPVTGAKLADQARTYGQMMAICLAATNCKGLNVFGTDDGNWAEPPALARAGSPQSGRTASPLLFDEAFRPKAAYEALAAALRPR